MSQCATPSTTSTALPHSASYVLLHACLENDLAALAGAIGAACVNAAVVDGLLPLQVAATAGHCDAVRALVAYGAQVDATDNASTGRNTALHFAVLARRTRTVRTLLDLGASPNAANCVGTTPMHDAARVGDIQVAEALKNSGANLTLKNGYGNTILQRACLHNNHEMVLWCMHAVSRPLRTTMLEHRNHAGYNVQDIAISRNLRAMTHLLDSLGAQPSQAFHQLTKRRYSELHAWTTFLRDNAAAPTPVSKAVTLQFK